MPLATNLRLLGVGVAIAGEQAPANTAELLELATELLALDLRLLELELEDRLDIALLDTELSSELLKCDDELDLLLKLDELELELDERELELELDEIELRLFELETIIAIALAELAAELSTELDELDSELEPALDSELDLTLLELLTLAALLKLTLTLLDAALKLACELAELGATTTTLVTELLWELSFDELVKLLSDDADEDVSPTLDATKESDSEETATLEGEELKTTADKLATELTTELAAKGLAELDAPPPPPQAFNKATTKQLRPNLNTREHLEDCIQKLPALKTKAASSISLKLGCKCPVLPCLVQLFLVLWKMLSQPIYNPAASN